MPCFARYLQKLRKLHYVCIAASLLLYRFVSIARPKCGAAVRANYIRLLITRHYVLFYCQHYVRFVWFIVPWKCPVSPLPGLLFIPWTHIMIYDFCNSIVYLMYTLCLFGLVKTVDFQIVLIWHLEFKNLIPFVTWTNCWFVIQSTNLYMYMYFFQKKNIYIFHLLYSISLSIILKLYIHCISR